MPSVHLRPLARLVALAAVAGAFGLATVASPARAGEPTVAAPSAIVVDAATGERLYVRDAEARRPIASTTKLMTALLALERGRPSQVLTSPGYSPSSPDESTIGLRAGEQMTLRDLLRALLLPSANDAAHDIAVNFAGSQRRFVRWMNARARALRLRDTHYTNPIGLDEGPNYSSAADLATLAARLLHNDRFARIVALPRARLRSGNRPRVVVNRNTLVGRYDFVDGVKTGHTIQAGYVLVGGARRDGVQVVSVVLGDSSEAARDSDSLALLHYGLTQLRRVRAVAGRRAYGHAAVRGRDDEVRLVAVRSATVTVRRGRRPTLRVNAPSELKGPLPAGRRAGSVAVVYRGRVAARVPLVTAGPVPAPPAPRRFLDAVGGTWAALAFALVVVLGGLAVGLRLRARARGSERERAANDHHGHAKRGNRQDARRA